MSKGYKIRMMLDNYLRLLIFQLHFHGLRMFELEKKFRDAALYIILLMKLKVRETMWFGKVTMYVSGRAELKTQILWLSTIL